MKTGTILSEAFARQGVFPPIYVTSVLAGERSGSLVEVLERFISYQKLTLALRKKLLVALIYPTVLICLVIALIVFLVTFVVPNFASLYNSMQARLPAPTQLLIAIGTTARSYVLAGIGVLALAGLATYLWSRRDSSQEALDRLKIKIPVIGDIWVKYQVAQFSRILSTLLQGGIPLVQALGTSSESLGTPLLKQALAKSVNGERRSVTFQFSHSLPAFSPGFLSDMIEVGESTGALPAMLNSVADFYEDDVGTRMTAPLSMIEPAIMIFMGIFVAFVLIALYLPIFSLADTFGVNRWQPNRSSLHRHRKPQQASGWRAISLRIR